MSIRPSSATVWVALFVLPFAACGSTEPAEPLGPESEAATEAATEAPAEAPAEATAEATVEAPAEATVEATVEAPAEVAVEAVAVVPRAWPHETSDIPVDPRIHFGHLDNGLRWAWAENSEPEKRVYIRLHVDVGSLAEEDDERGMAHFLEHLAFNGSKNFPAGTLVEWFQTRGMDFGSDTNAHTSISETVYKLALPEADEKSLREGLLVLRDFADRLLITEEEVEAEKGVIASEYREWDSPQKRVRDQALDLVYAGTLFAERQVLGEPEVFGAFTAESIRAFYEKWYRPDNMTLVVVGDLEGLDVAPLFEEFFGDMSPPTTPLPPEPDRGRPARYDHSFVIHEEEIPEVNLTIEHLRPWQQKPATLAEWTEDLPLRLARGMLSLRFRELAKEESAPFIQAAAQSAEALDMVDGEALYVRCDPDRWSEALAFCEQELRRAIVGGFSEAELAEQRADMLRSLDEAVEREPTAHSLSLVNGILQAAEQSFVPADARTTRDVLRPVIEALTVEACDAAFREAWTDGELSIAAWGNLALEGDAGGQLLASYRKSAAVPVEARAEVETGAFAYASDPDLRGEITSREEVEDLGFTMVTFANGVTLSVKRTDVKENQILIDAQLGEGGLTLETPRPGLQWVGSQVLSGIGLEAHDADDLRRLTAGKQVGVGLGIGHDAFSLGGATTEEDLLTQCELMCAYLEAPGWRPDSLVQLQRQIPLMYERLARHLSGPLVSEFLPAVFSGDRRFSLPTQESVSAVEMEQLRAWLAPHFAAAPLDVQIVGDLDVEATIDVAARTLGRLPSRRDWRPWYQRRHAPTPKSGIEQTHAIETDTPKSMVVIAFPIPDALEAVMDRSFTMLNDVVNDRLRLEVREKLGAAYSPGSGLEQSMVFPGVGMLLIQAMADPDKVDTLVEACLAVGDSLATDGVTEEELERLRVPLLKKRRDDKRNNGYWIAAMSRAHRDATWLDRVRSGDAFYEAVKAADLSPLAAQYLKRERASVLVVNPDN